MSPIPFYKESNQIIAYGTTEQQKKNLVLTIANGYKPTGNPIDESLMYIPIQTYIDLKTKFTIVEQGKMEKWILLLGNAEMNYSNTNSSTTNNWWAHQIKTISYCGDALNNTVFLKYGHDNIQKYINTNLYPDGSCIDFHQRDSCTYVTYALNALVLAIFPLQKHFKFDYYNYISPKKSSIKRSVYWLFPYIEKKFINLMFLKSIYASDVIIHKDQYGKEWIKDDATQLFLNCEKLDPSLTKYINTHLSR